MKWILIFVSMVALFVVIAAAAVAQERKWGEQGSDCPWGSNTCRVQGVGGGTSNSSPSPDTASNTWDSGVWDTATWGS